MIQTKIKFFFTLSLLLILKPLFSETDILIPYSYMKIVQQIIRLILIIKYLFLFINNN